MQEPYFALGALFIWLVAGYLHYKKNQRRIVKQQINRKHLSVAFVHNGIELQENFISAYRSLLDIKKEEQLSPALIESKCYDQSRISVYFKKETENQFCSFHDPDVELAKLYLLDFYQYSCHCN